ncbi:zinc-binding dehydrogenase [Mycolicibacterium sp. 120270]|uniref:zinc-binding dehydrogenase n=1 Tax=Mycolicibacterium sp. 120270 TaxID=3090600 RepID=UPI00299D2F7E|nr:zinc-binding dehydrogenase [Mycolicibacterium sp. 120270]MDX1886762.1 zinc-binding dehydrogenase [Mycolicibacterium sp. 120270]
MRAAVLRDGRMVQRDDVAEPVPETGQVLVAVKACGICGSDLHFAAHGEQMVRLTRELKGMPIEGGLRVDLAKDVFMGHEFSAEVLEPGPDTDAPPPGTMVTSLPVLLSPNGFEPILTSNTTIGGFAERMLLSAPLLLTIPNGLDPKLASLTEPMAVGLHAVNKSAIEPGDVALVVGCGPIGLAIVAALRRRGVEHIAAADYSAKRRDLAITMGAHQVLDPAQGSPFDGVAPTVVFEAVGVPGIVNDMMRRAPLGARLVIAGVCMEADPIQPLFGVAKEISVQFVNAYDAEEFADSLRAIAEGEVDVAPLITAEVGLDGVGAAFDDLADPDAHCKILVTPATSPTSGGR